VIFLLPGVGPNSATMGRDLDHLRGQGTAIRLCRLGRKRRFGARGPGLALHSGGRRALALAESERWFLVHTHPKGERRAQLHLGGRDSGRTSHKSTKLYGTPASSGLSGHRYSLGTSSSSSTWDATPGYRCGALSGFPRYLAAMVDRSLCLRGRWNRSSSTRTRPL
jgi:hypothetical protein